MAAEVSAEVEQGVSFKGVHTAILRRIRVVAVQMLDQLGVFLNHDPTGQV